MRKTENEWPDLCTASGNIPFYRGLTRLHVFFLVSLGRYSVFVPVCNNECCTYIVPPVSAGTEIVISSIRLLPHPPLSLVSHFSWSVAFCRPPSPLVRHLPSFAIFPRAPLSVVGHFHSSGSFPRAPYTIDGHFPIRPCDGKMPLMFGYIAQNHISPVLPKSLRHRIHDDVMVPDYSSHPLFIYVSSVTHIGYSYIISYSYIVDYSYNHWLYNSE